MCLLVINYRVLCYYYAVDSFAMFSLCYSSILSIVPSENLHCNSRVATGPESPEIQNFIFQGTKLCVVPEKL